MLPVSLSMIVVSIWFLIHKATRSLLRDTSHHMACSCFYLFVWPYVKPPVVELHHCLFWQLSWHYLRNILTYTLLGYVSVRVLGNRLVFGVTLLIHSVTWILEQTWFAAPNFWYALCNFHYERCHPWKGPPARFVTWFSWYVSPSVTLSIIIHCDVSAPIIHYW